MFVRIEDDGQLTMFASSLSQNGLGRMAQLKFGPISHLYNFGRSVGAARLCRLPPGLGGVRKDPRP